MALEKEEELKGKYMDRKKAASRKRAEARFDKALGFNKDDKAKQDWSLLPFKELKDVVKVFELGASKYGRNNYLNCDDSNRYRGAMLRHIADFMSNTPIDDESGLSHLAHIICNALILMQLETK